MIDTTQAAEDTQIITNEVIVLHDSSDTKKPLEIDYAVMTIKAIADLPKDDLKQACKDRNLFKNMAGWKVSRLNKIDLAKLLKEHELKTAGPKKDQEDTNDQEDTKEAPTAQIDILKLQNGVFELLNGKEPKSLDSFANDILANSQREIVSAETAQKLEGLFFWGSFVWIYYRKIFGTWDKFKVFYSGLKTKFKKKEETPNANNNG